MYEHGLRYFQVRLYNLFKHEAEDSGVLKVLAHAKCLDAGILDAGSRRILPGNLERRFRSLSTAYSSKDKALHRATLSGEAMEILLCLAYNLPPPDIFTNLMLFTVYCVTTSKTLPVKCIQKALSRGVLQQVHCTQMSQS